MTDLIKRDDALAVCDIAPPDEWNDYTKGGYDFATEECKRNIAALPAVTVGAKPLRYFEPEGSTVEQIRDHARQHPLAQEGDMKLVWVNEGDLSMYLLAALTPPPVADSPPAAIREAALREAADACTYVIKNIDILKVDGETYETPRIQKIARGLVDVARQDILALIGETK